MHSGACDSFTDHTVTRDAAWHGEVERAIAMEFAAREGRSVPANFFAWVVSLILILFTGITHLLIAALALRLVAMTATHRACAEVGGAITKGEEFESKLNKASLVLASSGISWGMLTWGITGTTQIDAPMVGLLAVVTTGVCLICSVAGLVPRTMGVFSGFFISSVLFGGFIVNGGAQPGLVGVILLPLVGAVSWGIAMRRQATAAASDAVDKLYLREELETALSNAEFLSCHDALTGLANRRALFSEHHEGPSTGKNRYLLLLDLDHFKWVNDRYGHTAGDDVLIAVADTLRRFEKTYAGAQTKAYRLGGEEFAIIIEASGDQQLANLADGLRLAIREDTHAKATPGLRVTASLGICEWADGAPLGSILARADLALYRAKAEGRDRVARDEGSLAA